MDAEKIQRVVIVGNYACGKTALLHRIISGGFNRYTEATIGCNFSQVKLPSGVRANIWDTGGAEKFRSIAPIYIRNAVVALVCFERDTNNVDEEVLYWVDLVNSYANPRIIAVCCKCDEGDVETCVDAICTSAVTGHGVDSLIGAIDDALRESHVHKHEQIDGRGNCCH